MKMNWKMYIICILITVFAPATFFPFIPYAHAEEQMIILPDDAEKTWFQYINKRLNEEIQREGRSLRVQTKYIGAEPSYSYVSLNHPYTIDCNTYNIGISIYFSGDEDNEISANITGDFSPDHKNEPDLKIEQGSYVAKALDAKTCKYVADWIAEVISE